MAGRAGCSLVQYESSLGRDVYSTAAKIQQQRYGSTSFESCQASKQDCVVSQACKPCNRIDIALVQGGVVRSNQGWCMCSDTCPVRWRVFSNIAAVTDDGSKCLLLDLRVEYCPHVAYCQLA
jgi:hypothetical protein